MNRDLLLALRQMSWVVTAGLCWLYAAEGFSTTPAFDRWGWGTFFWIDVVLFVLAVRALVLR